MFSTLFFLLISLTLITFIPEVEIQPAIDSPFYAFVAGLVLYGLFLGLLYWQGRKAKSLSVGVAILLTHFEFLVFLCLYAFWLGAYRLLTTGPVLGHIQSVFAAFALGLYLFALGWSRYWCGKSHPADRLHAFDLAYRQVLFVFPFCIPFIILNVLFDLLSFVPQSWLAFFDFMPETLKVLVLFGLGLFLFASLAIFVPCFIVMCWRCKPLPPSPLRSNLEAICQELHFKHAGFKIWTVMQHALTAGIIGIVPRFRYVMFTPRLLNEFPSEEIEAILVHEIGHSRYKHLLFYPLVIFGMVLIADLIAPFYEEPLHAYATQLGSFLYPVINFALYALTLGVYFRLVFGFYSRLFERQADIHIFETNLSPVYMVRALDHIAVATGYTHFHPSWHHHSIQKRIHFLEAAMRNPKLVQAYHRKVWFWVKIYFIFLAALSLALFLR